MSQVYRDATGTLCIDTTPPKLTREEKAAIAELRRRYKHFLKVAAQLELATASLAELVEDTELSNQGSAGFHEEQGMLADVSAVQQALKHLG